MFLRLSLRQGFTSIKTVFLVTLSVWYLFKIACDIYGK